MRNYIIRRVLLMIPTVFIISVVIFVLIRLIPGDAIDAAIARMSIGGLETAQIHAARELYTHQLGLDVPIFTQYGRWIVVLP